MKKFHLARSGLTAFLCFLILTGPRARAEGTAAVEARLRQDVATLASDELEGRGVTTKGIDRAADYIAGEFKKAGLRPAGENDSYFQPFTMPGATLGSPNTLLLSGPKNKTLAGKLGEDFQVLGLSHAGQVTAPVVFAGYGATTSKEFGYDDYQGIDVEGKVVVILRDTPRAADKKAKFDGGKRREHASFTAKMQNALKHGAAGVLFVNDQDTAREDDPLLDFGYTAASPSPAKLPVLHVRRRLIDAMLQASQDVRLRDLERDIDKDLKPKSAPLEGWTVTLEVNVKRDTIGLKNVVGVLEGKGPLADETVVLGAHYDHLGYGGPASMAGMKRQAVHHGADDNASGTAALLELARRFGAMKDRAGRRLVFIAFSGEEIGLLGSVHYCKHPLFPLDRTVAMVNMDMVGRLRLDKQSGWGRLLSHLTPVPPSVFPVLPLVHTVEAAPRDYLTPKNRLIVYGTGTAKNFSRLIDDVNQKHGFRLKKVPGGTGPSDHATFYIKKIPVYFFFTDVHDDYHRPSDTADKINVVGMRLVTDLVGDVVEQLAKAPERPQYVKVTEKNSSAARPEGRVPRIGIKPDYGDAEEGVLVGGVTDGGPADKVGLKEGDRIVAVNNKPVKDLQSYMTVLGAQKQGEAVELRVVRNGQSRTFKVVPE